MSRHIPTIVVVFLVTMAGCAGAILGDPADSEPASETETPSPTSTPTDTTPAPAGTADGESSTPGGDDGEGTPPTETETTPQDSDGDGLTDEAERSDYGTDPTDADTDGDGLDDGVEVDEYDTDPAKADTDEDGLDDGAEVREFGTEPTSTDTDDDGLADGREVNEVGSDPTVADTDGDNLSDGREVDDLGTDPTAADTDSDGLDDHEEIVVFGTNATLADTDGDGLDDAVETNETVRSEYLPGADPTHKNLYLNVEYRDDCESIDDERLEAVESEFASAPVSNPDGVEGIDLVITQGRNDTSGYGYFEGQVVEELPYGNPDFIGVWVPGNTFWVECRAVDAVLASVVMHELGHATGLNPLTSDEDGIDTREKSFDEYESVMNYNSGPAYLGYSSEDWETIAEHMDLYVTTVEL